LFSISGFLGVWIMMKVQFAPAERGGHVPTTPGNGIHCLGLSPASTIREPRRFVHESEAGLNTR
ncbi:MAG: hypothetical protein ACOVO0_13345, partial [Burkholderiaceae bacterium]